MLLFCLNHYWSLKAIEKRGEENLSYQSRPKAGSERTEILSMQNLWRSAMQNKAASFANKYNFSRTLRNIVVNIEQLQIHNKNYYIHIFGSSLIISISYECLSREVQSLWILKKRQTKTPYEVTGFFSLCYYSYIQVTCMYVCLSYVNFISISEKMTISFILQLTINR